LTQILKRLRIVIQPMLIEHGSLLEQRGPISISIGLWSQIGEALTERCLAR
jgi:hypothetical protein